VTPAIPARFRRTALAALLLPTSVLLRALDWQTTTAALELKPFQGKAELEFAFVNRSDRPVRIVDLRTSCDCLVATADRDVYPPGTAGRLRAEFTVGDRFGLYERTVTVVTDEPGEPTKLAVRLNMPPLATLTPRTVEWAAGAAGTERSVDIVIAPALHIDLHEVVSTTEAFAVRLETLETGRHYRLHVAPKSTAQPAGTAIRIRGREQGGRDVLVSAYANVR